MALADFLQALLRQPGGPQNALAQAASAQGTAGPVGTAQYGSVLQAMFQPQSAPQTAPQAAPQGVSPVTTGSVPSAPPSAPAPSPAAPAGNGLSGLFQGLESILNPQARGKNDTINYLTKQGYDPGTAMLIAGDKPLLRQVLVGNATQNSPKSQLELEKLGLEVKNLENPTTDDIRDYNFYSQQEKAAGRQPIAFNDWRIQGKRAGATNISDIGNTKGETTYDQNLGKSLAEKTVSIMDAGMQAPNKIGTLQMMKNALGNVYQGAGGESIQNLRRVASSLGFDVQGVGEGDLVQSISNQLALQMRNPAGGAGMPGAMSDADREFLKATVPGLGRTPEGNAKLIDYMTRVERRNMDVAKLAQTYMDQNGGRLDYKFFNQLSDWSKANPLFPERPMTPDQSKTERGGNGLGAPSIGTVEDGWVFQGGDPGDPKSWKRK